MEKRTATKRAMEKGTTKRRQNSSNFDIVNVPFVDGDVPRSTSYGVNISQLIRFARVSSHVDDFDTRDKVLTAKLLRQGGYRKWAS